MYAVSEPRSRFFQRTVKPSVGCARPPLRALHATSANGQPWTTLGRGSGCDTQQHKKGIACAASESGRENRNNGTAPEKKAKYASYSQRPIFIHGELYTQQSGATARTKQGTLDWRPPCQPERPFCNGVKTCVHGKVNGHCGFPPAASRTSRLSAFSSLSQNAGWAWFLGECLRFYAIPFLR